MNRREMVRLAATGGAVALMPRIAAAAQSEVFVARMQLMGPRAVIPVTIGGKGPYLFLIDTGGFMSLIDDGLAIELGLRKLGKADVRGIGGATELNRYEASDVNLGGLRQSAVSFAGFRDGAFGRNIRGALASGIVTELDGDLDFEKGEWRLYPDGRKERPGFTEVKSEIRKGGSKVGSAHIYAHATIEGETHRFLIDTGAPGEVQLFPQAVRKTSLWDNDRPWAPVRPRGVGGEGHKSRLIRADGLEIGGIQLPRPLLMLNDADKKRDGMADGIIGLGVLRQLNLSTDTRRGSLWVQKNAVPPPPRHYALSGIWIEAKGTQLLVDQVGHGSPAQAAGVAVGDEVLGETFRPLIAKLAGPPGREVKLRLRRDGAEREVALRLDPYL